MHVLERDSFDTLLKALQADGYETLGPVLSGGAIVYGEIASSEDLPVGYRDTQAGGSYRLTQGGTPALFDYVVGPQSLKNYLNPAVRMLWRAHGSVSDFRVEVPKEPTPKYAFIGVRPCELQAMAIQDAVFLGGTHTDPAYRAKREQAFFVAVNCSRPADTCFCVSMGGSPKAGKHFDLSLTEILDAQRHYFVVRSGSGKGSSLLEKLPVRAATPEEISAAARVEQEAAEHMGRSMDTEGVKELLYSSAKDPHFEKIAERCLACGNCTMVCPTCFCSAVEDRTSLDGAQADRWRVWNSCFTLDFTYMHGGSVRHSGAARYRQWITHKLAAWQDQFGTSGCTGCGRCITWCPVGIDITEEVAALRESQLAKAAT